ncbi:MAG: ABC transporter substrate binding protein [Sulfuritalea sp.]|uniref:ABC transporter substrate-binding protein n=1 Tax=Sulfuriferula sp. TaxID=2025307 RepID=UPI002730309D|nr:ABC transporter substrate binding protein [Sulfuriferula sp.]MDP1611077.1 ABC transporter substrate binding protein [Sulfuritalea sp.]MDP2027095.1 ABC transporter substrate binding protein [Sulfuriferula sp.]
MTYGSASAAGAISVWVALSDTGQAHTEAAQALRMEVEQALPGRIDWRVAHWKQFDGAAPKPQWIVGVGTAAQRGMQELFARDTPPPLLSVLVPRLAFERMADPARLRAGSLSAVFLDQPPSRQLELIRLALPGVRTIGMLVGAESKGHLAGLEKAARERGLELVVAPVAQGGLFDALQSVLPDVGVLLALPDPSVFNSQTAANILTAAYRRQVPLVGFSPAYVKAGALLALYSTPAQVGARGGEVLRQALAGKVLPSPQWPREFVVSVNQDVARSLGFALDEARIGEQLRQKDRP